MNQPTPVPDPRKPRPPLKETDLWSQGTAQAEDDYTEQEGSCPAAAEPAPAGGTATDPGSGVAAAPQAPEASIPPDLEDHPRYHILGFLGRGGMGTVFRAQHRLMQREVALKIINSHLVERPNMVERFRREARAAASLSHPNIVHAYDADQAGASHFLVMEFVPGINLDELLLKQGRLSVERAADYARQAAQGMQHAYRRGMAHGDVKPHNLILTPQGRVKILDFGLARFISEQLLEGMGEALASSGGEGGDSMVFSVEVEEMLAHAPTPLLRERVPGAKRHYIYTGAGTADYMAPEEILNPRLADVRSDIYSLGCTLYRFLCGQVPFPGGSVNSKLKAHLKKTPAPLADVPAKLSEVVARMMAKDPSQRYQTPAEVVEALAPFAGRRRGHILLVEDDLATRVSMRAALQENGFAVVEATNGQEALDRLRSGPLPDLILLDLIMPVMNGTEFLDAQRKDPALAGIPVVIVSAASQAQAVSLCTAGYLQKPLDVEELTAVVPLPSALPPAQGSA